MYLNMKLRKESSLNSRYGTKHIKYLGCALDKDLPRQNMALKVNTRLFA